MNVNDVIVMVENVVGVNPLFRRVLSTFSSSTIFRLFTRLFHTVLHLHSLFVHECWKRAKCIGGTATFMTVISNFYLVLFCQLEFRVLHKMSFFGACVLLKLEPVHKLLLY